MAAISGMLPLINTLLQGQVNMLTQTPQHRKRAHSPLSSPARPDHPPSSPPPALDRELRACLDAFGHKNLVDLAKIEAAFTGLSEKYYLPDSLSVASLDRISELTGLAEGEAASLVKFAQRWSGKIETKRAKLAP